MSSVSKMTWFRKKFLSSFMLMFLFLLLTVPVKADGITKAEGASYSGIAVVDINGGSVNIRSKASTSGTIVGTLRDHGAATISKTVNGEGGKWYYIKSGDVKGYIKASYMVTGEKAAAIAKKYGSRSYGVGCAALRLREKASTSSKTLVKLPEGTKLSIVDNGIKGSDGYTYSKVKVTLNGKSYTGYCAQDYIKKLYTLKTATAKGGSSSSSSGSSSSSSSSSSSKSSKGSKIVSKAKSYVGKLRYVYGGTSLKKGADCSGFVQAIYRSCGISLPRTAAAQASRGKSISYSKLQPGDLVFYRSGRKISHVGIYIGGGKMVHEANRRRGCVIDRVTYMKPCKYVTYLHK